MKLIFVIMSLLCVTGCVTYPVVGRIESVSKEGWFNTDGDFMYCTAQDPLKPVCTKPLYFYNKN